MHVSRIAGEILESSVDIACYWKVRRAAATRLKFHKVEGEFAEQKFSL